ncbi:hypothetical protein Bpfe_003511, partial [Biomphalaria pfeifferi]
MHSNMRLSVYIYIVVNIFYKFYPLKGGVYLNVHDIKNMIQLSKFNDEVCLHHDKKLTLNFALTWNGCSKALLYLIVTPKDTMEEITFYTYTVKECTNLGSKCTCMVVSTYTYNCSVYTTMTSSLSEAAFHMELRYAGNEENVTSTQEKLPKVCDSARSLIPKILVCGLCLCAYFWTVK